MGFGGEGGGGGMEHRSVRTSRRAVTPRTLERPREMRLTKTTMKSKTLLPPPPPPFAPVRTARSAAHALLCVCARARCAAPGPQMAGARNAQARRRRLSRPRRARNFPSIPLRQVGGRTASIGQAQRSRMDARGRAGGNHGSLTKGQKKLAMMLMQSSTAKTRVKKSSSLS